VQGSDCRVAAGEENGGIAFNGITLSPDKRRLLVADTKSIVVFDITGPGSLRRAQLLPLPHFIDNIEVRDCRS
jgi:sugar lactone lactonase YvrE